MWSRVHRLRSAAAPAAALAAVSHRQGGAPGQVCADERRAPKFWQRPRAFEGAATVRCEAECCSCGSFGRNAEFGVREEAAASVWPAPRPVPQAALDAWMAILGPERFFTDRDSRDDYAEQDPAATYYPSPPSPQAVAQPSSTEEVVRVLQVAHEHKIPVVTYGGGTSLEGAALFSHGGLCLDLRNLDQVLQVHEEDAEVTLQAAVGWQGLNESLGPKGLMLGVDPGPGALVGGMVATNCSGPHAFRWGMMRQSVVNVTAVLADGTVIKTRQRPRKTSAGYDLTGLLTGSEGTLAVITEATLRLQRVPPVIEVARVGFPSVSDAFGAVREIKRAGLGGLMCCELLSAHTVKCVNLFSGTSFPEEPMLLLKFGASSSVTVEEDIRAARAFCAKHTKANFEFSQNEEERDRIWQARKSAGWAVPAYNPNMKYSVTDSAVPMSRGGEYIDRLEVEFASSWLQKAAGPLGIIAHIGDGNVHCVFPFDKDDPAQVKEAKRLNSRVVKIALEMEGTCTGEHGVGINKRPYLLDELGPATVGTMWSIKRALDPHGILNPGKVLPDI